MNNLVDYGFGNESDENYWLYFKHQGESANKFVTGDGTELDFKHFLIDVDSIKTGWVKVRREMAPVCVWNDKPNEWKANPAKIEGLSEEEQKAFSKGFNIDVFIQGEGQRTWSGASWGNGMAFQEMMRQVNADKANNPGMVPVIEFGGIEPVAFKSGGGSSIPSLKVVKWIPKPADAFNVPDVPDVPEKPVAFEEPAALPIDNTEDIPF